MTQPMMPELRLCLLTVLLCLMSVSSKTYGQAGLEWVHRTDVGTPGKRVSPAMAYDSDRGVTVFFGGEYSEGSSTITYYNDTWEYDGNRWQQIAISGPLPDTRSGHTLTYDTRRREMVLFGGVNEDGYHNDTWTYLVTGAGSGTWIRKANLNNLPPFPSGRAGHAVAFDSMRGLAIITGGTAGTDSSIGAPDEIRLKEYWGWNGTSWEDFGRLEVPIGPYSLVDYSRTFTRHAMAFDSLRGNVLMGGGIFYFYIGPNASPVYNDAEIGYLYLVETNSTGNPVAQQVGGFYPRQQFAMVYDSARDCLVVFGGVVTASYLPDNHVGNSHQELGFAQGAYQTTTLNIPTPPPRARHAMVYDSKRQVTVLFGGVSGDTRYDDTWELVFRHEFWVDYSYTGTETGDFASPFRTLSRAAANAPPNSIINFKPGVGVEPVTISQLVTLMAPGGPLTINGR